MGERELTRMEAKCDFEILDSVPFTSVTLVKIWGQSLPLGALGLSAHAPLAQLPPAVSVGAWALHVTLPLFFISPDVWSPFCFEIVLQLSQSISGLAVSHSW